MAEVINLKLSRCFIHFNDVSQALMQVTSQRSLKFISCRKRWVVVVVKLYFNRVAHSAKGWYP